MSNRRFFKRSRPLRVPVNFKKLGEQNLNTLGFVLSISAGGASVTAPSNAAVGDEIVFQFLDSSALNLGDVKAEVAWTRLEKDEHIAGIKFDELSLQQNAMLVRALPRLFLRSQKNSNGVIKNSLLWGVGIIMPAIFILKFIKGSDRTSVFCFIGIYVITLMRIFETFLTSRDPNSLKDSEDWTISAVVFYYVIMLIGVEWESLFVSSSRSRSLMVLGVSLFIFALAFRIYCVKRLGRNWGVHVAEDAKSEQSSYRQLVSYGPYRYIRHPIYLGVICELISIPLIFNAWTMLIFVIFVNIPLQVLRARFEETILLRLFGPSYSEYSLSAGFLFPKYASSSFENNNRKFNFAVDFKDRRGANR